MLGGDGRVRQGLQVHRPAAAARVEPGAEADEAAGHARRTTTRCSTASAPRVPGVTLRTTFIVGFPGETEADVDELCGFVARARASTTSACSPTRTRRAPRRYALDDDVPARVKKARRRPPDGAAEAARRPAPAGAGSASASRVLVDGPSRGARAGAAGRGSPTQAPEIDAVRLPDRLRPVALSPGRPSSTSRSSARGTTICWRVRCREPAPVWYDCYSSGSEPGVGPKWAVPTFSVSGRENPVGAEMNVGRASLVRRSPSRVAARLRARDLRRPVPARGERHGAAGPDRPAGSGRRRPRTASSVEDCARVSRDLSAILDVEDVVPTRLHPGGVVARPRSAAAAAPTTTAGSPAGGRRS